jgi:DNA-binding transcriptional ArsR family regulator
VLASTDKGRSTLDSRLAKALGHPLRVRILEVVNERAVSPVQFFREFGGESLPKVAYHFRVLEKYDCIECVKEVQRRGATEHFFRGTRRALFGDADWKHLPKSVQGGVTGTMLQGFVAKAAEAIQSGTFDAREDSHFSWISMMLDEDGWQKLMALLASTLEEAQEIQVEAGERVASTGEVGFPVTFGAAGFESPGSGPKKSEAGDRTSPESDPVKV